MTKLEELRKLAEAATPGPWTWMQVAGMGARRFLYGPDTKQPIFELDVGFPTCDFIAAANPQTILAMCELMQQMRDALQSQVENISAYDDPEDTLFDHELHVVSALKAFDKFNKGE